MKPKEEVSFKPSEKELFEPEPWEEEDSKLPLLLRLPPLSYLRFLTWTLLAPPPRTRHIPTLPLAPWLTPARIRHYHQQWNMDRRTLAATLTPPFFSVRALLWALLRTVPPIGWLDLNWVVFYLLGLMGDPPEANRKGKGEWEEIAWQPLLRGSILETSRKPGGGYDLSFPTLGAFAVLRRQLFDWFLESPFLRVLYQLEERMDSAGRSQLWVRYRSLGPRKDKNLGEQPSPRSLLWGLRQGVRAIARYWVSGEEILKRACPRGRGQGEVEEGLRGLQKMGCSWIQQVETPTQIFWRRVGGKPQLLNARKTLLEVYAPWGQGREELGEGFLPFPSEAEALPFRRKLSAVLLTALRDLPWPLPYTHYITWGGQMLLIHSRMRTLQRRIGGEQEQEVWLSWSYLGPRLTVTQRQWICEVATSIHPKEEKEGGGLVALQKFYPELLQSSATDQGWRFHAPVPSTEGPGPNVPEGKRWVPLLPSRNKETEEEKYVAPGSIETLESELRITRGALRLMQHLAKHEIFIPETLQSELPSTLQLELKQHWENSLQGFCAAYAFFFQEETPSTSLRFLCGEHYPTWATRIEALGTFLEQLLPPIGWTPLEAFAFWATPPSTPPIPVEGLSLGARRLARLLHTNPILYRTFRLRRGSTADGDPVYELAWSAWGAVQGESLSLKPEGSEKPEKVLETLRLVLPQLPSFWVPFPALELAKREEGFWKKLEIATAPRVFFSIPYLTRRNKKVPLPVIYENGFGFGGPLGRCPQEPPRERERSMESTPHFHIVSGVSR